MNDQVLGFNISMLVHGIVVVVFFALNQGRMFENKPIVLDLSIESLGYPSDTAVSNQSGNLRENGAELNPVVTHDRQFNMPQPSIIRKEKNRNVEPPVSPQKKDHKSPSASLPKTVRKLESYKQPLFQKAKPVYHKQTQPKVRQTIPTKAAKEVFHSSKEAETTVRVNVDSGKKVSTDNHATIAASGTNDTTSHAAFKRSLPGVMNDLSTRGQSGNNSKNIGQNYINIHFNYLRDRIRKHLCYPSIAQKMGWDGKVLVAFTILKDGHVDDLEIKKSCGRRILDRSALETVRMACPFPKPPAVAKIVIPIIYKLN